MSVENTTPVSLSSKANPKAVQPEEPPVTATSNRISVSSHTGQEAADFDDAEAETAVSGHTGRETADFNNTEAKTAPSRAAAKQTAEQDTTQLDKDSLLSIVRSIPAEEELLLSGPDILDSPQVKKVRKIIDRFHESDSNLGFLVFDLNSGNYFSLNPDVPFYSASAIKGPYVASLNKFSPEITDEYTEYMMENTIEWSSNEDYEALHYLYGNDAMYDMTEYTDVSDSIIDEYNWYPYLTAKELTRLWIGMYLYFFEDTNENSKWCRSLYTDSAESFIHSALSEDYTVYTKAGWYSDWEDVSRNDAGIVMADGHDYILTVLSDAFDSYDDLEELAAALDEVHGLLVSSEAAAP